MRLCLYKLGHFHLRFCGGWLKDSSPAFLFAPNPIVTFERSLGPGVPPCDGESTADEILENPGLTDGTGDAELLFGAMEEKPDGARLSPLIIG
jgi:hypothetical protein